MKEATPWHAPVQHTQVKIVSAGRQDWKAKMTYDPRDGRFPGDPHGRVGWGWGGVGDDNVLCTCTHGRCYATSWDGVGWGMITFLALAHMVGATQHHLSCTCTHGRCYATSWDGVGWGGVGDDNVPCTCTHGRCYATSSFLYLHTWSLLRNIMGKKDVTHS